MLKSAQDSNKPSRPVLSTHNSAQEPSGPPFAPLLRALTETLRPPLIRISPPPSYPRPMKLLRHRLFQVALSLAIGVVLLWLAIARIDVAALGTELSRVQPGWLIAGVATYWVALALRSWRWRILLAPVRRLAFGQVFYGLLVGYAANNLLPARLGELVRADFVGRRYRITRLSVVGTIVVERLFDVVVFVGFIFAGIAALHTTRDVRIGQILHLVELVAVGCVVLVVLLLAVLRLRHKPLPRTMTFLEKHLHS